jgi:segregation and condensation protein B
LSDDYNTANGPDSGTNTLPLSALLESLLFVADGPVALSQFATALDATPRTIEAALVELEAQYQHRGLRIQRDKAGVQLTTAPQTAEAVEKFLGLDSTQRLSRPAVETLAIIAYQQPITRPRIEAIRGVNSDGVIKSLLTKGLIEEVGRTEGPGRPVLYSSTPAFLQHFGLSSVNELPPLDIEVLLAAARVLGPENDPAPAVLAAPATEPAPDTAETAIEPSQPGEPTAIIEEAAKIAVESADLEPIAKSEVESAPPVDLVAQTEQGPETEIEMAQPDDSAAAVQDVTEPPVEPERHDELTPAMAAGDVLTAFTDPALAPDDVASRASADPTPFIPLDTDTLSHLENESMLNTPELLLEDTIADFVLATGPDGALIAPVNQAGDDDEDEEEEEEDDWVDDDVDDEDEDEEEEDDEIDELDPDLEEVEEVEEVEEDEEAAVILEDEEESLEEIEEEEDEDEDDWEDDDDEDLDLDDDDDDDEEEEEEEEED